MEMFWLIKRTEPSHSTNWQPLGCWLKLQSSLIALAIVAQVQPQLMGELVRPLVRTDSSSLEPAIQRGQTLICVGVVSGLPKMYDDSPTISVLLRPSVISARRQHWMRSANL